MDQSMGNDASVNRIMGIDPGSRLTGYGIVDAVGEECRWVASGTIRSGTEKTGLPQRLQAIYVELCRVMVEFRPSVCAVEQVFVAKSADSALKLGQARGAALLAAVSSELTVIEYAARRVKQTVTGSGAADKQQVQRMVKLLLALDRAPAADAADALALAICHAHSSRGGPAVQRLRSARRHRRWTTLP